MASNDTTCVDEDGDSSDWIELANLSDDSICLSGYSLSDNPGSPKKWSFPDVCIPPHAYLLIWASGEDRKEDVQNLHTSFKLDAEGEFIGLYDPAGVVVDSITFGSQETDISVGRFPDGTGLFVPMDPATPGSSNVLSVALSFSVAQGVYPAPFDLALVPSLAYGTIRYTLDGSTPDSSSNRYEASIPIEQTAVVRARVFEGSVPLSREITALYVVNETPGLPVLSLITAPENLWDSKTGIYENYEKSGDDWERPASLALIEEGQTQFQFQYDVGIRIHGQLSRGKPKKSFRVYFREEYGKSKLEYPLFGPDGAQEFKRLIIHSTADDASSSAIFTHLRDVLTHALWAEEGGLISEFRPVVLYLNGVYWGVYWLRERIDRYYVETHFGIDDCDLLSHEWTYTDVREGDKVFWDETLTFFKYRDLTKNDNYQTAIQKYIDCENFTDYHLFNIFAGNYDWPQKNNDHFRDRIGDPRWRWTMWDNDVCWQYDPERPILEWATRDDLRTDIRAEDQAAILWSTLILSRLLENNDYYVYFINRFMDLMNTTLSVDHIFEKIDELSGLIRPEMEREMVRWGITDLASWDRNLQGLKVFANSRVRIQRQQLQEHFDLQDKITVNFLPPEGEGTVTLNTITISEFPWSGVYFLRFPMQLKANPAAGFRFVRWKYEGSTTPLDQADTWFQLFSKITITPVFEPTLAISNIVVSDTTANSFRVAWQTNMNTQSRIYFDLDSACTQFSKVDENYQTDHEFVIDSLSPDTPYYFYLWNRTENGDTLTSEIYSVRTNPLPPIPPEIESIRIDSVGTSWVSISWQTNDSTTGCIDYTSDSQNWQSVCDTTWSTSHPIRITGLEDTTLYVFHVRCQNKSGLTAQSNDTSFLTLKMVVISPIPTISDFTIRNVTYHSAEIRWYTKDSTCSKLDYCLDTEAYLLKNDTLSCWHVYHLEGLKDTSCYTLAIQYWCPNNLNKTRLDTTFWTRLDREPPEILKIEQDSLGIRNVIIRWQTDEATSGLVRYGTDKELKSEANSESDFTIFHRTSLAPLDPDTWYYYQIGCWDSRNNRTESPLDSFRTAIDTTSSAVQRIDASAPERFSVSSNYPNPFNSKTHVEIGIPRPGDLEVMIFNVFGQIVRRLYQGKVDAGVQRVSWRGENDLGVEVSSGIYLFKIYYQTLEGQKETQIERMIFQK